MRVSLYWLREWANPDIPDQELMERLTMAGLEIDAVEPVSSPFSGVVVGKIISVENHPGADKLKICQVEGHPEEKVTQVVCGAPNAIAGMKVPFALTGAMLPSRDGNGEILEIKSTLLRGVESSGMLCAASELGIDLPASGLMELPNDAVIGQDIRSYLGLEDVVLDINITPNRGDCLSIRGLGRELVAITSAKFTAPEIHAVKPLIEEIFPVELQAHRSCSRYVGRIIRNINTATTSPVWLKEKLRRSGIRSIDPVVDVTNYVLLELGQPMHAFDLDKLDTGICVRSAHDGESLTLLNGQEVTLTSGTLLIADSSKPLALAGIMGGVETAVSGTTRNILLEAAYFDPVAMAGKAREYGLHTDSSQRFERGVDIALQELAIERATALLLDIVGGLPGPLEIRQSASHPVGRAPVDLQLGRVRDYLGLVDLTIKDVAGMLQGLGMQLLESTQDSLRVIPPGWRFDIHLEVDLLEEIARIYGYNKLPARNCPTTITLRPHPETVLDPALIKQRLASLGYREVVTYSFVDPAFQELLGQGQQDQPIPIQNPISAEMAVMRTGLLSGLVGAALHNIHRQQEYIRIFECGPVFRRPQGKIHQEARVGLLLYGWREPESWSRISTQLIDFYDLKGDVEALLCLCGVEGDVLFSAVPSTVYHPGQNAVISLNGAQIGWMGMLHPALQRKLGLTQPLWVAEIHLEALRHLKVPHFQELSRFPEVRRDLAVLVDRQVPVQSMLEEVKKAAGTYLTNLKVFDVYSGEGIDPQRKSVALGLTFRAKSRTLTDSEINENMARVVETLGRHFQADLRS